MAVKKTYAGGRRAPRYATPRARAVSLGYRSGLEENLAVWLEERGYEFAYEAHKVAYEQPATPRKYTPDFVIPNGVVIETKGRFTVEDRKKHLWIKDQYPDLDVRFVFSNSRNKLRKGSPTSYAMWCEKNGFPYADKVPPEEWLKEPPEEHRLEALKQATT